MRIVSAQRLCDMTGWSLDDLRLYVQAGLVPLRLPGVYDLDEVKDALCNISLTPREEIDSDVLAAFDAAAADLQQEK